MRLFEIHSSVMSEVMKSYINKEENERKVINRKYELQGTNPFQNIYQKYEIKEKYCPLKSECKRTEHMTGWFNI